MTNSFKPSQKLLCKQSNNFIIHPRLFTAFSVWHQFCLQKTKINLSKLQGYYNPSLKVIKSDREKTYYFFNDFEKFENLISSSEKTKSPFIIIPEYIKHMQRLAWSEVLHLCFEKYIHHPSLYHAILEKAPKSLIMELIDSKNFLVNDYCQFAQITHDTYKNQQRLRSSSELALPSDMSWLRDL